MEKDVHTWGRRIRAFRKLKGYTQEGLAKSVHVSVSVIGAVERGTKAPTNHLLEDIAQELEIDLQELKGKGGRKTR